MFLNPLLEQFLLTRKVPLQLYKNHFSRSSTTLTVIKTVILTIIIILSNFKPPTQKIIKQNISTKAHLKSPASEILSACTPSRGDRGWMGQKIKNHFSSIYLYIYVV
jgi:hypothetical protein